ncbi:MAG: hypothetical protein DMG62_09135 [Acidobacteria bacterium]|nr:MAG: hypothetical protein DMG63_17885 [Acidobacteriota bacterium]PYY23247.1 MAG: hypothetical protein DMG62_09135 [Acidobacteriota bacterium]
MNHPSEQNLVLYFYGDAPRAAALDRHLAECKECAAEFAQLRATLSAIDYPVPDRPADYEAQLWSTLRPRLEQSEAPRRSAWAAVLQPRRWAIAGALAAIIVGAFLLGRISGPKQPGSTQVVNKQSPSGKDRVLMVAVGDHLDRTEMILVELANTRAEGKVDISAERDFAQTLVNENRLYRQTAQRDKDPEIANVLDQVERVLIDIAHHPDSVSGKELEELQQRIESQGVLFKVRVIESKVKARSRAESGKPKSAGDARL